MFPGLKTHFHVQANKRHTAGYKQEEEKPAVQQRPFCADVLVVGGALDPGNIRAGCFFRLAPVDQDVGDGEEDAEEGDEHTDVLRMSDGRLPAVWYAHLPVPVSDTKSAMLVSILN